MSCGQLFLRVAGSAPAWLLWYSVVLFTHKRQGVARFWQKRMSALRTRKYSIMSLYYLNHTYVMYTCISMLLGLAPSLASSGSRYSK